MNLSGKTMFSQRRLKRATSSLCGFVFTLVLWAVVEFSAGAAQVVTLDWLPSSDERVVGYNIYYGLATGGFSQKVPVDNITSAQINGLAAGETYHFTVTARDAAGNESPPTETVSFVVPQFQPVVLTTQIYLNESEKPFAMGIEANTDSSSNWQLEYSLDLQTWLPYSNGTGANAFALVPFGLGGLPQIFFRIQSY